LENLYSSKLENIEEMVKSLDALDLQKSNQEDKSPNRSIISNEIETVIVSQQRKAQVMMASLLNSTRSLKKN
jgi:hypothetical protein